MGPAGATLPGMAWGAGGGRIWRGPSKPGSGSCWPSTASALCCGGWAFGAWCPVPGTPVMTRRRRRRSGRLRLHCRRGPARARPRQATGALVAGRGPHRPAGYVDPGLGRALQPPARATRPALRLGLPVRRGLPRARHRCCLGAALRQRRDDEPAPRRDQQTRHARRARCPDDRRRGLAPAWRALADPTQRQSRCCTCHPTRRS